MQIALSLPGTTHFANVFSMKSIEGILDLWPSVAKLGRDLGVPYATVAAWKQRGSIPVAYWRGLIDAARARGLREVTSELLVELHDPRSAEQATGFAEPAATAVDLSAPVKGNAEPGQFSRWKALRRSHFTSADEIVEHVQALRSEWDRR